MAFFSFSLLKDPFTYLSTKFDLNKKYYSKDIDLWKELNNRNKSNNSIVLNYERRINVNSLGKSLLICLPPKFGLGDSIEYGIAIYSLIKSNKFHKIGIAFCSNYSYVFTKFFSFSNVYPLFILREDMEKYDTVFHVTLEITSLKFQKYKRKNIALEICKHFRVPLLNYQIKKFIFNNNYKKTISIFPVSTSVVRSLPHNFLEGIIENFSDKYLIRIIVDDSSYSHYLSERIKKNNSIFVNPKNIKDLILEIAKVSFGIFIDSGPLHVAKLFNKNGIFIETSVNSENLVGNSKNIFTVKNKYNSSYCSGPCGLVDVFAYNDNVGCYETHKISFEKIKYLKSFKNLQRWNKKEINANFILNPIGCVKEINLNNIIESLKIKLKERQ